MVRKTVEEAIKKLRAAWTGREVRDRMADTIEAMNEEVTNTSSKQSILEETFNNLIINEGNSNAEVVAARVDQNGNSYDTLGKRMNNFDEQLDTNVQNLNIKINDVAEKGTTVEVVTNTTKTVIEEKINDGTIANMTIKKNSITVDKLQFIDINKNLLEGVSFIQGYYDPITGAVAGKSSYKTTELIPFSSSILYTNVINNITYFDLDKAFIIGHWGGQYQKPLTPPSNAKYIAITFENTLNPEDYYLKEREDDSYMIKDENLKECLNNESLDSVNKNFEDLLNNQNNNFININKIKGFNYTATNLYNESTNESLGTYINPTTGKVVSNIGSYQNYKATDYIEVEVAEKYSSNIHLNYAFYDSSKTYISGDYGGWTNPITVPKNARYIRFTIDVTVENIVFCKGNTVIDDIFTIENFLKVGLIKELGIEESKLNNLVWNVFGDSMSSVDYSKPTWWQIIAEKNKMIATCYGISGTTLAHTHGRHLWDYNWGKLNADEIGYNRNDSSTWSTGNCFCERFTKMNDSADLITVMGGTNDNAVKLGSWNSTDTSTFYGALNVLIQGLINKYPNKKIAFFTPLQMSNSYLYNVENAGSELDKKSTEDTLSLQLRAEAIKRKCAQFGIPCLDLYNISGVNGVGNRKGLVYRNNDDTHLSVFGNEYIVPTIESFLLSLF
ncbi:SGNH/GDSL hydrolase family protein [Clostridium sp.]|jgi:hypothetical protein|uniref:SGNH/GDSL hydrolase family protein n=1 Tax=Clostridium sp. TaxID=1506 RepID=UPI00399FC66E